jgi:nitrite reductase (NO-forming)
MNGVIRRRSTVAVLASFALAITMAGCSAAPPVEETGETTQVEVRMLDGRYHPDVIEVPVGNRLIIDLVNDDLDLHDLEMESGAKTERFGQGMTETLDVGIISTDLDGWCSVPPHREHGMVLTVRAVETG